MVLQFEHKNILKVFGFTFWTLNSFLCFGIISEEIEYGNLQDLVKLEEAISWKLRYRIFTFIADGLFYLHFHNPYEKYIHLDIKPENILLSVNLDPKLADFGSSQTIKTTGENCFYQIKPTILYAAPEVLENPNIAPNSSMDVYR